MLLGEGSERHVDALGPLDVFDDQATGNLRDHDRDHEDTDSQRDYLPIHGLSRQVVVRG